MSRTKKHRDIFFLKFLNKLIKGIGNPRTHSKAARYNKIKKRISKSYGASNWGDNQYIEDRYNQTAYFRAKKRSERYKALQEAYSELRDAREYDDYLKRVQIQREWWESLDDPEDYELEVIQQFRELYEN